ncbi:hypothetical protein QFC19_006363 [Naganishia cerealis]|uniref:Uncharacterized protein n=1 Tax=Naganishia cerealis TaxID=610337 RepID=A0ACC2VHB9_9TREE|nr:hypothetical protein QFC19_006363 [Naganishia cerealis]
MEADNVSHSRKPSVQPQSRIPIQLDPRLAPEHTPRQEHAPVDSAIGFNLDLSTENDRIALTRYTNQTITSLAAYRDALIDENARLNAMLIDARAGLIVLSNSAAEAEPELNGNEHNEGAESALSARRKAKRTMMDVVKESMLDEISQLRNRAARLLLEEEQVTTGSGSVNGEPSTHGETSETPSKAVTSALEATSAIYYATLNKLQDDLVNSRKRRDDAKISLVAICRQPGPSSKVNRGVQRKVWPEHHGVNAMNGRAMSASDPLKPEQLQHVDDREDPNYSMILNVDEAILDLLTDQEEIVWMRERREREMEKALRDMKCYVEAMIREWREVGSLPPPGKYQTLSYPELNLPYIPTQIFPKRKGRPPRASVKVQQIPESLQHLVARSRTSRITDKARDHERFRRHVPAIPYTVPDDTASKRGLRRKGKGREMDLDELQEDAATKRRRLILGDHASEYEAEGHDAMAGTTRHDSLDASNAESLQPSATASNRQEAQLSAEHLYGVSASAISDAMEAYTQQPMPDENSVFGPSGMPGQSFDPADVSFDTQIPYQVQMVQRRALGYPADVNVPDTLVNGGNVFDNSDDVQLGGDIVHQSPHAHEQDGQYVPSNSFRAYDQAAQDSVEGMIQQHIRDAQASAEDADNTLMQMQHVDNGNLEVSDAQQALDTYRFEEALMDHDINAQEDQQANSVLATSVNADSADATALAAQRLMNSLVPHATADFDPSCQNCGRRDTSVWRKLTVNGVDYKVCNACGLHYQKNGVMRPRSLWGDIAAQPRKRRSQRPFGSTTAPSAAEQHQHDMMIDEALYEDPPEDDGQGGGGGAYDDTSYDVHYADGQYGMEEAEEGSIATGDLPHYGLGLQ